MIRMVTDKSKKPELRFKGFSDDWEQCKLGDEALEILAGGDVDKSRLVENGKYPVIANALTDDGIVGYYEDNFRVKAPAVTVTGRGDVGHAQARKVNFTPVVRLLSVTSNHDVDFLAEAINQNNVVLESTGVPQLTVPKLASYKLFFPPTIEEERKIGQYFLNLDHLITLHQRKCENLKIIKKSMLDNLFPKNGEKIPRWRFKGFNDDWEQRKFGDIVQRRSTVQQSSHDLPGVEYEDVVSESGILNKNIRDKETNKNGILFDGNQVLYGKLRPYLHNWLNPDFKGVAVGDWWVLQPIDVDKDFLYRLLQTQRFDDVANQSSGSKMPRADWNLVSNTNFMIPNDLEEQSKIGQYFLRLDNLITLHQSEVERLKKVKQFFLDKMFI